MNQYHNIDAMTPGESVLLLVTASNPDSVAWAKRTPVKVERLPAGWMYESAYGLTAQDIAGGPATNPGRQGLNAHMMKLTGVKGLVESARESDLVRRAYRVERRRVASCGARGSDSYAYAAGCACYALHRARVAVATGTDSRYGPCGIWAGLGGCDGATFAHGGESAVRWFENPESKGLRLVGFADDVANLRHSGWFLDDVQCETVRGVVYQLPAHKGCPRFLFGYVDPFNDGPVCLSLAVMDSANDAARRGDSMAESYADETREHDATYRAGQSARRKAVKALENCRRWIQSSRDGRAQIAAGLNLTRLQIETHLRLCRKVRKALDKARAARLDCPGARNADMRDSWLSGYQEGEL